MNRMFNHTFSQSFIPLEIAGGLVTFVILFGSTLKCFHRLSLSGLMNYLLASIFVLIAVKYVLEAGGELTKISSNVKRLLVHQFLDVNKVLGTKTGERNRVLNSSPELRMYVLSNKFATSNSFPDFMDVAIAQTVNYVLAF